MSDQLSARKKKEARIIAKALKDDAFRQELIRNPREVFKHEFGKELPHTVEIRVVEEDLHTVYLVIPAKPPGELSDLDLHAVAAGLKLDRPTWAPDHPQLAEWEDWFITDVMA